VQDWKALEIRYGVQSTDECVTIVHWQVGTHPATTKVGGRFAGVRVALSLSESTLVGAMAEKQKDNRE